jgi:hypothetical protein
MIDAEINMKDGFGRFMATLGRVFRLKSAAASRELKGKPHEPQSEAEEALYLAMGYAQPDGEGVRIVNDKIREALAEA